MRLKLTAVMILLMVLTSLGDVENAVGEELSPYDDFLAMSEEELATLQGKLTYLGPETAAFLPLLFAPSKEAADIQGYVPYRRPGVVYAGDISAILGDDVGNPTFDFFPITAQEAQALIDAIATLPEVTDGGVDNPMWLSFSLMNVIEGSTLVFESILDKDNGRDLFTVMRSALSQNAWAVGLLDIMACNTQQLPVSDAYDATSEVSIEIGGLRFDRQREVYATTVKVTNVSQTPLPAPISFVPSPNYGVALMTVTGFTCGFEPTGRRYTDLMASGELLPGQEVEQVIMFVNPGLEPINLDPQVICGLGPR